MDYIEFDNGVKVSFEDLITNLSKLDVRTLEKLSRAIDKILEKKKRQLLFAPNKGKKSVSK